jgi:hypothetical protein
MTGPSDPQPFRIARGTVLLGFAGLIPQAFAVLLILIGRPFVGIEIALAYGLLILSFLGGIWWGFAVRRTSGQASLAAIAVVPSLVAMAIAILVATTPRIGLCLVATGDAPADWLTLRLPLSIGLGTLTIVAGLLTGGPHALF